MSALAEHDSKVERVARSAPWPLVRLGDVAKTGSGGTPKRTSPAYYGGGIPWVKSGELGDSTVYETQETISKAGLDESSAKLFPKGTLCVALYGATVGKLGILGVAAATNQAVCGIFLPPEIDTRFAYRFLESKRRELVGMGKGGAQSNISQEIIRDLKFPLAPLAEQQRIVAEIEKQFTRLEAGVAALRRVRANLKRYRAAVLKAACEGRLVPTEAELNKSGSGVPPLGLDKKRQDAASTFETGEPLLARILVERRQNWQGRWHYKEPTSPDTTNLPRLPEGWTWTTADQLSVKITDGEHLSPVVQPSGVPLLSAKDVRASGIVFEDAKYVSAQDAARFRNRCDPKRGDILIVSRGATIGRSCLVNTDQLFCLMGSAILIKAHALINAQFQLAALKSDTSVRRLVAASGSTAQQAIYIRDIRSLPLPLPPLAEQTRIVAEVERRFSVVEELEAVVSANLQRATRLRQSILQKAFTGKLVGEVSPTIKQRTG